MHVIYLSLWADSEVVQQAHTLEGMSVNVGVLWAEQRAAGIVQFSHWHLKPSSAAIFCVHTLIFSVCLFAAKNKLQKSPLFHVLKSNKGGLQFVPVTGHIFCVDFTGSTLSAQRVEISVAISSQSDGRDLASAWSGRLLHPLNQVVSHGVFT